MTGAAVVQAARDGFYVLGEYGGGLLLLLAALFGTGVWLTRLLPDPDRRNPALLLPLSLCLGALPLAILSFAAVLLARLWPGALAIGADVITCLGGSGVILWLASVKAGDLRAHVKVLILGAVFFLLVLVVRLSFLRGLLLPPGYDSAVHAQIVRDFLSPRSPPQAPYSIPNILQRYYHFGFHSLAAWFVTMTGVRPEVDVPLLGQLFLVLAPVSVFCLAAVAADSYAAAFAAAGLAFLGWKLPAFAANWAKYPALAAVAVLPSVLGMLVLAWRAGRKTWAAGLLALCLVAGETLFHSRALICLALAVLAFSLAGETVKRRRIPSWASLPLAVLLAALCWTQLNDLVRTYVDMNYRVLALVLVLSPLAFAFFPRPALAVLFYMLGVVLVLKLPLPAALHTYTSAWLDFPFLEIMAYVPLALLGGLGLGGLLLWLKRPWQQGLASLGFALLVLGNAAANQSFSPDPFYNFARPADVAAIAWIGKNVPPDARVVISGAMSADTELRDFSGSDAGVWVAQLTGRRTLLKPFKLDWSSPETRSELCGLGKAYVYSGGWPFGFDPRVLSKLDWLTPVEEVPPVVIFQVGPCPGGSG